jgi:DNA polymerase III delta prime subunit
MDNSYKIYFILDAEFLNLSAANKLLKTIEEPGDKIIGFLLTSDINLIIPTIKSRCEIFKDSYETIFDEEIIKSSTILKQNLNKKYIDNYNYKKELMKIDKNNLILILKYLKKLYEEDLNNSKSISLVANKIKILDNIICMFYSNVSIELVLDKMFIELGN